MALACMKMAHSRLTDGTTMDVCNIYDFTVNSTAWSPMSCTDNFEALLRSLQLSVYTTNANHMSRVSSCVSSMRSSSRGTGNTEHTQLRAREMLGATLFQVCRSHSIDYIHFKCHAFPLCGYLTRIVSLPSRVCVCACNYYVGWCAHSMC